uniref:Exportin-1 C-terminal domain-containing protein n=1 Tax=Ditylenchus dipsaci TaxID=166011 RepID=A0A915CXG5_9BILA
MKRRCGKLWFFSLIWIIRIQNEDDRDAGETNKWVRMVLENLSTLCWAIGSISGALNEDEEKTFLVTIIRRGKTKGCDRIKHKYVVGQYPRFLRAHWKFLKTVINKLFEFMHESHEGVKICLRYFHQNCSQVPAAFHYHPRRIICDLSQEQVHVFFERCSETHYCGVQVYCAPFFPQLKRILNDMMSLYQVTSGNLNKAVNQHGESVLKQPLLKTMRVVKREILTLLSTWIATCDFDAAPDFSLVSPSAVIEHFSTVLVDYEMNVPAAREPKVLSLLSISIVSLKGKLSPQVPSILNAVFACTLEMINKDMEAYPEHRTNFFQLLSCHQRKQRPVTDVLSEVLHDDYGACLGVVTDLNQVPFVGLTNLAEAVCLLFQAVESSIEVPLNSQNPNQQNVDFVYESVASLFNTHFSKNLTDAQIRVTIKGFFSFNRTVSKMREHIRDFLVQIKEEAGEDTSDLFLEEKEAEIQKVQAEKRAIPGVANPNDLREEEELEMG